MMENTLPAQLSEEEQFAQTQALLDFSGEISTLNHKTLLSSIAHTKGEQINVDIDKLRLMPGFNPRIKNAELAAHIRHLADSMKAVGFYSHKPFAAVAGYEGKRAVILITEGGCRYDALQLALSEGADIPSAPVVLQDKSTTIEDLTLALIRSNDGKRFSTLELAITVKRLFKFNWSIETIAEKTSFSVEYVNQLLAIAGAPHLIREMIANGEVPAAVALQTIRAHGDEAVVVLKEAVTAAKAQGKKGITRKHLPDQIRKKAINKAAPKMMVAIERVKAHEAFKTFPLDLQEMIDKLMAEIIAVSPNVGTDSVGQEAQDVGSDAVVDEAVVCQ